MHPEVNPAKTHHKTFVVSYINTHTVESSLVSRSISLQMAEMQTCLHISPNFHLNDSRSVVLSGHKVLPVYISSRTKPKKQSWLLT